MMRISKCTLC